MGQRQPERRSSRWSLDPSRPKPDGGFTLLELLIVITILPLVIGAISVSMLTVFKLQSRTATNLAASSGAKVIEAKFVNDVQSSQEVTTSATISCGAGTPIISLSPDNAELTMITYAETGSGSTRTMSRNVCVRTSTSTPYGAASSKVLSFSAPSYVVTVTPAGTSATSWAASPGMSIKLVVTSTNGTAYSLTASPQATSTSSGSPPGSFSPLLPLELLGGSCTSVTTCTCPTQNINITNHGTINVGTSGSPGWIGIANNCSGSVVTGNGSVTGNVLTYANPPGSAISGSGYTGTTTTSPTMFTDPLAGMVKPNNPTACSAAGTSSVSGKTFSLTSGVYTWGSLNVKSSSTVNVDPTKGPCNSINSQQYCATTTQEVVIFNDPVSTGGKSVLNFAGDSSCVSKVVYWFKQGLTVQSNDTVNFGLATYIFGDTTVSPNTPTSSQNAGFGLNLQNGSMSAASGLLMYIAAGNVAATASSSTSVLGTTTYDGVAIWDAAPGSTTFTWGNASSSTFGGIYFPLGIVTFNANSNSTAKFLIAQGIYNPTAGGVVTLTG